MLCDCLEKGDSRIMGRAGFRAMHRGNVFHGAFLENDFRILFEEGETVVWSRGMKKSREIFGEM